VSSIYSEKELVIVVYIARVYFFLTIVVYNALVKLMLTVGV